jgi:excisionase family DNA binding protein
MKKTNGTYLTPEEVAKRLQVSEGTLANWRSKRRGPPYMKRGGILYPAEKLDAWEESKLITPKG